MALREADLLGLVSDAYGKDLDYAGIRALADRIVAYYHRHGFPFVNVYVPPQSVEGGVVSIRILEGRYGLIETRGAGNLPRESQPFLNGLHKGDLIRSAKLERSLLVLGDQPGIRITPYIQPGSELGVGDLVVAVRPDQRLAGMIGIDNSGSRYTGQYRAMGGLEINSPLMLGDKLSLNGVLSDQMLWLGAASYELPLGHGGLRARFSYSHTRYDLGGEFTSLQAHGLANVAGGDLEYPLLRSQNTNLRLQAGVQKKWLQNRYDAVGLDDRESSLAEHATLRFDKRDKILGGGVIYGGVSWWHGKLTIDPSMLLLDMLTTRKAGVFNKWTLDVARLQRLPLGFGLYNRFSGQWSDRNLESSERLALGGADGVRAYPVGEGMGDTGWLVQSELRYGKGWLKPYVFFDVARSRSNRFAWDAASDATRSISGYGFGARINVRRCSLNALLSWPGVGGAPTAAPGNFNPHWSSSLSCAL